MSIEKVTAWQTSDGRCYARKAEAYHEEMTWLVRSRENHNNKPVTATIFDESVEDQAEMVQALRQMREGLHGKRDLRIIEELDPLIERADAWLRDAQSLKQAIDSGDEE